eukprot:Gregarina_sp_Poly_1__3536@NODE_2031_length_2817_cov_2659_463273_g392_i2_p1_GENE_NODE_2031_length_2817_cov_2659_463273_g392_i2NODE_2031_length_2817_cov_2659_463273_g392_i2_p1_ORF_typecomplete_len725_score93_70Glyco_hydro_19/PF00182_19/7e22CBM_5_12_2/PF14600_6/0_026CBM_5_12_2/PF14600_6/0_45CBM_5_12_2/PF14600_6/2_8e03CBM_5_12_2/PF14600_6/2_6e03SwrA/PF17423_2/0_36_NODE_2031_length_2817_cov_2659_463273_g392_i24972671
MKSLVLVGIVAAAAADDCSSAALCLGGPWVGGSRCVLSGSLWEAKYWVSTAPSAASPAWTLVQTCSGAIADPCVSAAPWDASKVYDTPGHVVLYSNALWTNAWWSGAGTTPKSDTANWSKIVDCGSGGENPPVVPTQPPVVPTQPPVVPTQPPVVPTQPPVVPTQPPVVPTQPPVVPTQPPVVPTQPPVWDTTPLPPCTSSPTTTSTTTTTTTTSINQGGGSGSEVRPNGPTGANGECVWPEWENRTYRAGAYVGLGNDVYTNTYYADKGMGPANGAPWVKAATCTGSPPRARYTVEEMLTMLDPNYDGYQVIYDPWTPLVPTETEMAHQEAVYRSTPVAQDIVRVNRMLPVDEVEKVTPGAASNPSNVKRVEGILSESLFDKLFPVRHKKYTYANFLKAVALFPAYCDTYTDGRDSEAICKKILATSFAHYIQETGANHGSLFYKADGHSISPDNINDGADEWYTTGQKLELVQQGLWFLREVGHTEGSGGDSYRSCELISGSMFWQLTYPCGSNVDYFGRGSKQLSWNYNYGPFSQQVYGDAKVLLNNPAAVADSWLNFASGFWFSVTPQSPKPPMLWVLDGTWVPNDADIAAGRTPGFGATTNIINGGLECNGANHNGPKNRANAYKYFMSQFGLTVDPNEDLECQNMKLFDQSSSAATEAYYTMNWSGEAKCDITSAQTAWQLSRDGDYAKCVKFFFRSHWFKNGKHVSDFGLAPGENYS